MIAVSSSRSRNSTSVRGADDVGMRLGLLDVVGCRPRVDQVVGVEDAEEVLHVVLRGRLVLRVDEGSVEVEQNGDGQ